MTEAPPQADAVSALRAVALSALHISTEWSRGVQIRCPIANVPARFAADGSYW